MPRIEVATYVDATPESLFVLSLDVDAHVRSMSASGERVRGDVPGQLGLGDRVTFEARHFGIPWRMTARITEYEPPRRFVDEQVRGPFARWRHEHVFAPDGDGGTRMQDRIDFTSPVGPLGRAVDRLFLSRYLTSLITSRSAYLADLATRS